MGGTAVLIHRDEMSVSMVIAIILIKDAWGIMIPAPDTLSHKQ